MRNRMGVACIVLALFTSTAEADLRDDFNKCNADAARLIARQEGDPVSLGTAAYGICIHQAYLVLLDIQKHVDASLVDHVMGMIRADAIDTNAGIIATIRSQK